MSLRRIRARVTGRVQGVGFRYFTWSVGRNLDLVGYVRNEPDGVVLVEAEGPADSIAQLLLQVQRGPANARVERTEVEELAPVGGRGVFEVG